MSCVLVTGATAGFGAEICRRFSKEGWKVVATGRREERLAALQKELGAGCRTAVLDVRERGAMAALLEKLPAEFAPDVLVANAGLALGLQPAQEADLDDWDTMIDTNVKGLAYSVRETIPGMIARGRGHVVLLGSVAGDHPYPGGNVYGASKAFVKQFALNLKADLLGTPVRATSVEPGLAETEFSLVRFKGDAAKAQAPYQGLKPLTAADIAECVWWACSLPEHVNVNRLEVMPSGQAFGPFLYKRK